MLRSLEVNYNMLRFMLGVSIDTEPLMRLLNNYN